MPTTATKARKITKFQLCDFHRPWFDGTTKYRKIECLNEGGPGSGRYSGPCQGGQCRIWPGTDYHCEEVCHSEMELDWTK